MNRQTKVYKNVFDSKLLDTVKKYVDNKEEIHKQTVDGIVWSENKHSDLQDSESFTGKVLLPKIKKILGYDFDIHICCYKTSKFPYGLHNDSHYENFGKAVGEDIEIDSVIKANDNTKLQTILIPLVSGPEYRTLIFDVFDNDLKHMPNTLPDSWLTSTNQLDIQDLMHINEPARSQILQMPLEVDYQWEVGDIITWPREKIHCSNDFRRYGKAYKDIIVIFTA